MAVAAIITDAAGTRTCIGSESSSDGRLLDLAKLHHDPRLVLVNLGTFRTVLGHGIQFHATGIGTLAMMVAHRAVV